ncbi:MAG: hypothetical protein ABSB29_05245 [Nitrososphaerales archaeon]|jgi:hypothetical protein
MAEAMYAPLTAAVIVVLALAQVQPALTATPQQILASHWVPGLGYRDELNASDIDHQNFWTDNAGKILSMAMTTGDATDASHALTFLESVGLGSAPSFSSPYYLPEVVVNSSILELQNDTMITNRIVQLVENTASSGLQSLAIGDYYAGSTTMGYLGSDRIFVSDKIYRSASSTVVPISGGFSKRSLFKTSSGDFFLYLNATITAREPYAGVSIQALPLNYSLSSNDLLYLQVFSSSGQFDNASLYGHDGSFLRQLAYNNGSPSAQNGLIIPYSKQFSALGEDSVAVSFDNSTATVNDFEHWYRNGAFDGLSWIGIAYDAPANSVGVLSQPIYSKAYPLQHLDYRLANDTARYIATGQMNVAVTPPVSFGFISYGLALDAASNPQNATLAGLAPGYWNYYYDRYYPSGSSNAYSRSTNLLAMAGFTLYGCNSTVEGFTREFVEGNPGASIEEYGWAAAALHQLYNCTKSPGDLALYQKVISAFSPDLDYFVRLSVRGASSPAWTYQYGEAASGLMLAGVPFNNTSVLASMNAVFQSDVDGIILNQPFHGDLANTETLPAYMLSTWLFEDEMRNATQSVTTTVTSIETVTQPVTTTVTELGTTMTTTQTTTSTTTKACATCVPTWAYATMVVLLIAGLAVGYIIKRPLVSKP